MAAARKKDNTIQIESFDHFAFNPKGLTLGDLRSFLSQVEGMYDDEDVLVELCSKDGGIEWCGAYQIRLDFGTDHGLYISIIRR